MIPEPSIQQRIVGQVKNRREKWRQKLANSPVETDLSPYHHILETINAINLNGLSDHKLSAMAAEQKLKLIGGATPDSVLAEAFSLAREVCARRLGMRPYDTQMLAAIALHQGKMVQMNTGEGKTLAAVAAVYLNALSGRGVHVHTANDYLARRDAAWMGPAYRFLGLSHGYINAGMGAASRRKSYRCDVTYATAKEVGFDLLRDHVCDGSDQLVQPGFNYTIIDEADFILIDEARVPLVIAGETAESGIDLYRMSRITSDLRGSVDYQTDEHDRNVILSETGISLIENKLNCGNLFQPKNLALLTAVNQSLHARILLKKDIDYLVQDGKIDLVDEFTGRIVDLRRWPHGLQSAVEAKENLDIMPEGRILGSIALQHFVRLYSKVAGMTATALPAAAEFKMIYEMNTVCIPPHRPCIRRDLPDRIFTHLGAKNLALSAEIRRAHALGRPILVGTRSVAESERLAADMTAASIPCRVLNAKNDEDEAAIIRDAGKPGAVTISTNMAGRGTDIRLGGADEKFREQVVQLGGLYVIGTNRHESRRVDDQLRGRAGRQGDPGTSRFFISLEDDLMERYNVLDLIPRSHRPEPTDEPIDNPVVTREINRGQRIIEGQNSSIRQTLWQYSSLLEAQRKTWYSKRQEILHGDLRPELLAKERPERFRQIAGQYGEKALDRAEIQLHLFHMDEEWEIHLRVLEDIREGIHLLRWGGTIPLEEFHRKTFAAFEELEKRTEEKILASFDRVKIGSGGIDMESEGLTRPTSTWTYIINDNPFGGLGLALLSSRNIGMAAGAPIVAMMFSPIISILLLIKKWARSFKKEE